MNSAVEMNLMVALIFNVMLKFIILKMKTFIFFYFQIFKNLMSNNDHIIQLMNEQR